MSFMNFRIEKLGVHMSRTISLKLRLEYNIAILPLYAPFELATEFYMHSLLLS